MTPGDAERAGKIAKAAEAIAREVETNKIALGSFGRNYTYKKGVPCCVIGHVLARAGFTAKLLFGNRTAVDDNTEALTRIGFGDELLARTTLSQALYQITVANDTGERDAVEFVKALREFAAAMRMQA
jgi:hypothetical protein